MDQSTKIIAVILFGFVVFSTVKGTMKDYLKAMGIM